MKKENLPNEIPIFPLSNFIIFPNTTVPLNIFEPRYIDMIDDSMKSNKLKSSSFNLKVPELHNIGCLGKITTFKETDDGRYLVELKGLIRFKINKELDNSKKYRVLNVNYEKFLTDLDKEKIDLKFSDLELIFKNLKSLFEKRVM